MTPYAWAFLALAVIALLLLVVALGTVDEQRAEINKLRKANR